MTKKSMMQILVAIDSMKGCLRSAEANAAAAEGVRTACPDAAVRTLTVSDGGEGFIDAYREAVGGELRTTTVLDPLGRDVTARYLVDGSTAVLEVAEACGLNLLKPEERNPMKAKTYGVGQLVIDAVRYGATDIIVGLGGSGTSDAGMGMLNALNDAFREDKDGNLRTWMHHVRFTIATDVDNPLCGPNGAARVFAPQKGATPEMVGILEQVAEHFSQSAAAEMGHDCSKEPGAGAAGGLGYAFMQFLGAKRRSGIDVLLDAVHFDEQAARSALIITGEGAADRQTLMGKLPAGVLRRAGQTPVVLIAGKVSDREELLAAGFAEVACINPPASPIEEAMQPDIARQRITQTIHRLLPTLL